MTAEPSPLQPAIDRFAWASGHLDRIHELVRAFRATALEISDHPVPDGRIQRIARVTTVPPPVIGYALGDCLQQFRAVLENAVGLLRIDGPTKQSAYPVSETELSWKSTGKSRLDGLPEWAVEAIKSLQPFAPGPGSQVGHEVSRLHELAIRDRHRALLVVAAVADLGYIETLAGAPPTRWWRQDLQTLVVEYQSGYEPPVIDCRLNLLLDEQIDDDGSGLELVSPSEGAGDGTVSGLPRFTVVQHGAAAQLAVAAVLDHLENARRIADGGD